LRSCSGHQYRMASFLRIELTKQFQLQEHERQARVAQHRATTFSPSGGMRYSHLSLERFRTAPKYHDRPAAADIAFCVAAYTLGMPDDAMASTLDSEYLSRDPNPQGKLPTFSALWRRRDYGRTDSRSKEWVSGLSF
jgi:hypothetical protein